MNNAAETKSHLSSQLFGDLLNSSLSGLGVSTSLPFFLPLRPHFKYRQRRRHIDTRCPLPFASGLVQHHLLHLRTPGQFEPTKTLTKIDGQTETHNQNPHRLGTDPPTHLKEPSLSNSLESVSSSKAATTPEEPPDPDD